MGYADQEGNAGYDAFQVSSAISEVFPMAQTYAFNSDNSKCYAYLIPNGMMIGRSARKQGFDYGGNSDCSALLFMEQLMTGKTQDSLAVIISDGSPAPLVRCDLNTCILIQNQYLIGYTNKVCVSFLS